MEALASKRGAVARARTGSDRLAALVDLAEALLEFDPAEAVATADGAIELAAELGDPVRGAWARHLRGWAKNEMGALDEALVDQLAALAIFEDLADSMGAGRALTAIADIYSEAGDAATALDHVERAAAIQTECGDAIGRAVTLNITGICLSHEGRHDEAYRVFADAEVVFERLDDPLRVATARLNRGFELVELARSALDEGRPTGALLEEAGALARDLVQSGRELGDDGRQTVFLARSLLAHTYALTGDPTLAAEEGGSAWEEATGAGFDRLAVDLALDLVGWLADVGRYEEAWGHLDTAQATAAALGLRRLVSRSWALRARLHEEAGDMGAALDVFKRFHDLEGRIHTDTAALRSQIAAVRLQVERAQQEAEHARQRVAELEAVNEEKRQFIASVSHELRTPLSAVVGFADELAAGWEDFGSEEAQALVALIARQAEDVANIVDDLLTIGRLESGTMVVRPVAVDVAAEVGGLVERSGLEAARQVRWSGAGTAWADPGRLRQVIRNLLVNAFRYGGERVTVRVGEEARTVAIEVRDDGPAIPETQAAAMFEPFVSIHGPLRTPGSVGLGLAVARQLARLMGGDLVYLHDGSESVFRLTLPAAVATVPAT